MYSLQVEGIGQRSLMPAQLRSLQQAVSSAGPAELTSVKTPNELLTAISEGARHIQITEHLDLTTVKPVTSNNIFDRELFLEKFLLVDSTWSIQVRSSKRAFRF
jgi:hypothetical protein